MEQPYNTNMKIKQLIKLLEKIDGEKIIVVIDSNDNEYVINDVNESGEVWID